MVSSKEIQALIRSVADQKRRKFSKPISAMLAKQGFYERQLKSDICYFLIDFGLNDPLNEYLNYLYENNRSNHEEYIKSDEIWDLYSRANQEISKNNLYLKYLTERSWDEIFRKNAMEKAETRFTESMARFSSSEQDNFEEIVSNEFIYNFGIFTTASAMVEKSIIAQAVFALNGINPFHKNSPESHKQSFAYKEPFKAIIYNLHALRNRFQNVLYPFAKDDFMVYQKSGNDKFEFFERFVIGGLGELIDKFELLNKLFLSKQHNHGEDILITGKLALADLAFVRGMTPNSLRNELNNKKDDPSISLLLHNKIDDDSLKKKAWSKGIDCWRAREYLTENPKTQNIIELQDLDSSMEKDVNFTLFLN